MQIFYNNTGNLEGFEFASLDIFPHGVEYIDNLTYAVFKINIVFHGKGETIENFTTGNLNDLMNYINSLKWAYDIEERGDKNFNLVINANPNKELQGEELRFRLRTIETDKNLTTETFCFGKYFLKEGHEGNSFSAFFQEKEFQNLFIPAYEEVKTVEEKTGTSKSIHDQLEEANRYANIYKSKETTSGLDLGSIFSKILEEPIIAEDFYGIIRTFLIPIEKILKKEEEKEFNIKYNDVELGITNNLFKVKRIGKRYYNGITSPFLSFEDLKGKVEYTDLYQQELNPEVKENSKFDGFFVLGDFPDEEDSAIAGFNVLMKPSGEDNNFYSLSLHEKEISLLKPFQKKFRTFTSGVLQPKAEVLLGDDKVLKNRLLFVWRGENLSVNRISERNKETISVSVENQEEGKFLNCHFQSVEKFIVGGNRSLVKRPSFLLRTVSPLGYYLPLQREIELLKEGNPEDEKFSTTCTVEHFLGTIARKDLIEGEMPVIPIQAPVIVGNKTYENTGSDFMDSQHHMVVNKITDGKNEIRYIFPSPINFQNFRFKGYMRKERLRKFTEKNLTLKEFIRRCEKLEERSREVPESLANGRKRVQYLADPEATNLFFIPNDLFTTAVIKSFIELDAFNFSSNYPFYNKTFSLLVKTTYKGDMNFLHFSKKEKKAEKLSFKEINLSNGTYSFAVNHDLKNLIAKSALSELKISFVDNPIPPSFSNENPPITRDILIPNYWTTTLFLNSADPSMKSLKYMEETQVLELHQENLDELFKNSSEYFKYKDSLLKNEYPYGTFLRTKGLIGPEAGLISQVYPREVIVEAKIEAGLAEILKQNEELLRLPLSSKDEIIFGYGIKPGETEIKFYCSYSDRFLWESEAEEITIFYKDFKFFLQWGNEELPLRGLVNPEISIRDLKITDLLQIQEEVQDENGKASFRPMEKKDKEAEEAISALLVHSNLSSINVKISEAHVIIAKENHPYYIKKRLGLFSSSAFQAFFPKETSEVPIGSLGQKFDLEIPNNVLPETPVFETDILVQTTSDDSWRDRGSQGIKRRKSENLVRILLDESFMKEGPNKLGIIINEQGEKNSEATAIGGDITKSLKLTSNALGKFLKTDNIEYNLKKYLDEENPFTEYSIEGQKYEVFQCIPFFNSTLRKWQVVLSFHPFREEENVFIRLVVAKIAKGHGDKSKLPLNNSIISRFSEPQILPVYNIRHFTIEKLNYKQEKAYRISNRGYSNYKGKVYAVMQSRLRKKDSIFNVKNNLEGKINKEFEPIEVIARGNLEGVLSQSAVLFNLDEIYIKRKNKVRTIFVLEFEVHDNSVIPGFSNNIPLYRSMNPLFDPEIKGIRLINMERFEV